MNDPQHVLASELAPGAVFLYGNTEIRLRVLRTVVPGSDRLGREAYGYLCKRLDTGEEGWCSPQGTVLLAPEHTPGLTPVCNRCKALGLWDGRAWVHAYSRSPQCRTGVPATFWPQRVTPLNSLTFRPVA